MKREVDMLRKSLKGIAIELYAHALAAKIAKAKVVQCHTSKHMVGNTVYDDDDEEVYRTCLNASL